MRIRPLLAALVVAAACGGAVVPSPSGASPVATTPPPASSSAAASPSVEASPSAEASGAGSPPAVRAAYCAVGDVPTPHQGYDEHARTYLDRTYALGAGYEPPDLMYAGGARFRAVLASDLDAMRGAAAAAGRPLVVLSAYRSYAEQRDTFDHWVSVAGYEQALRTSARPGHSEHQLGTALDLGDGSRAPWEYPDWGATPTGSWLAANAAGFGFVTSYPRGKSDVTCYDYEPWHFRWVGREMAAAVVRSGLTLREYQALQP